MRKLRIIIFTLFIFPISNESLACLVASQDRIIPIGTDNNGLVAIEVLCSRYGEGEFGENLLWAYKLTLNGYNEDYSDYVISKLDSNLRLKEDEIEDFLNEQLDHALTISKDLDGFLPFNPLEVMFCDFQTECTLLELVKQEKEIGFRLANENKLYPIKFFSTEYTGNIGKKYLDYHYAYSVEGDTVGLDLRISSIRIYRNLNRELIMFHLSTGQEFKDAGTNLIPPRKEYSLEKKLVELKDATFKEPILHHGKGFDYYVLK